MKKEAFQEIAKHFAESIRVQIKFEDGATPSTDGKIIVLPTEMYEGYLDETLGALLHETSHIRYTDMAYFSGLDNLTREVTNVLEDIRVDTKSLRIHPNSRCFYMSLVEDVVARHKENLLAEALPIKVLKGLILTSVGANIKEIYGEDAEYDKMEELMTKCQPIINQVYVAETTQELAPLVVEVIKIIFGKLPEPDPDKQKGAGSPDKQCNGGQGGSGNPSNSSSQGDSESQSNIEQAAEVFEDYISKLDEETQAKEEAKKLNEDRRNITDEVKKCHRSAKTYQTKARNIERRSWHGPLSPEDEKKKVYYEQKAKERHQDYNDACNEESNKRDSLHKSYDKMSQIEKAIKETRKEINTIMSEEFARTGNCNLLGFTALDNDKLKDENYVDIPYNQSLDELIKETLILKQQEFIPEDTGRLNARYLHEVYTDIENLFQEKEDRELKTMVSLVVDVSGSMESGLRNGEGDRISVCLHALNIIGQAFSKAVSQGAPGDLKIFAFGSDVAEVVPTCENWKAISRGQYQEWMSSVGGCTHMADAVNFVVGEVTKDPEYRNIMIVLTDAEVDRRELSEMTNNISTNDVMVMYIAIGSTLREREAQELFGENNIMSEVDSVRILQNVMFQGLQQVT